MPLPFTPLPAVDLDVIVLCRQNLTNLQKQKADEAMTKIEHLRVRDEFGRLCRCLMIEDLFLFYSVYLEVGFCFIIPDWIFRLDSCDNSNNMQMR